ncbi:hypothetical protein MJO29_012239 [Puccinia striiformis f. sp. tritici]|nr:hypothetical protein MJO29_012239 [Puccinia striiformis f. sp. tritici]
MGIQKSRVLICLRGLLACAGTSLKMLTFISRFSNNLRPLEAVGTFKGFIKSCKHLSLFSYLVWLKLIRLATTNNKIEIHSVMFSQDGLLGAIECTQSGQLRLWLLKPIFSFRCIIRLDLRKNRKGKYRIRRWVIVDLDAHKYIRYLADSLFPFFCLWPSCVEFMITFSLALTTRSGVDNQSATLYDHLDDGTIGRVPRSPGFAQPLKKHSTAAFLLSRSNLRLNFIGKSLDLP